MQLRANSFSWTINFQKDWSLGNFSCFFLEKFVLFGESRTKCRVLKARKNTRKCWDRGNELVAKKVEKMSTISALFINFHENCKHIHYVHCILSPLFFLHLPNFHASHKEQQKCAI